ncbi:hypothetical protein CJ030_MR5G008779 [Morella rubra]|uniref:Uncharacterized protein n=1 Tax=Morella rubra TaxID=262757 RepID=A0A6A1WSC7_9ROSI|nr:hypothetical protein CJ030_MR5G008779 [Morella rubra]
MSPIPSPTLSAPSPRVNEGISQGTPACPSSCASTSASKFGRGRTRGDHFDLDYTRHVRTVVETMMTAHRMHRNRMHAYFKKFPSKEAALLKPHPDTTKTVEGVMRSVHQRSIYGHLQHQLAKARDEIKVMRAAREKDLQEFVKKQAEMEATLKGPP